MDALVNLEPYLRSRKEQLTPQEIHLMNEWKSRAARDFFVGLTGGAVATFLATKRLNRVPRLVLTAGVSATCGVWVFSKSLESTVDHLLSLQGTRVQGVLANLMMKQHQNDPSVYKRVSKYFYPETVYTDSSVDRPVPRLRYRNFFGDSASHNRQSTSQNGDTDSKERDVKITSTETKKPLVNAGGDAAVVGQGSPFDLVFGLPECAEDAPQPDAPRVVSKRQAQKEKRQRRRHRHHHEEDSEI